MIIVIIIFISIINNNYTVILCVQSAAGYDKLCHNNTLVQHKMPNLLLYVNDDF